MDSYNDGFWAGVWHFFTEMWTDWPIGTILGILMAVVCLLLAGLLLYGIFYFADSSFLPRQQAAGQVVDKTFTPAHTDIVYMYNAATKTSMPTPVYHSDAWDLQVHFLDTQDSIEVNHQYYNQVNVGDKVQIQYVIGRISRHKYLKEILG